MGLSWLGGDAANKAVGAAWPDLSIDSVEAVAQGLAHQGAAGVPVLSAGLHARNTDRGPIALALGDTHDAAVVPPLTQLLEAGGDESVAAATALGRSGQKAAVKPLLAFLKTAQGAGEEEAVEALGALKDPEGKDALVNALFSERPETRVEAVKALAALGVAPQVHELEALRSDYYREVRHAVDQTMGAAPASAAR